MSEEATRVGSWGDLRVGDRVRVIGAGPPRPGSFVIVELHVGDDALGSGPDSAVAIIRDEALAEEHTVMVQQLVRI